MKFIDKTANAFKYFVGLVLCLLFRLIPFRVPNVEPIMATTMPFAKKFALISSFIFGFLSILIYDLITNKLGVWTWVTAVMYGLVGLFAALYLTKKDNKIRYYVGFAVVATLVYDAITGIGMGVLVFHQSLIQTVVGQIPFTALHLLGNVVFAALLSPLIYVWIADNKNLETKKVYHTIKNAYRI